MNRAALAVALLVTTPVFAAIELGAPATVLTATGSCSNAETRCLAAAGDASRQMLVWSQLVNGRTRLRAASGTSAPVDVFTGGAESPSVAYDGHSFLASWANDVSFRSTVFAARLSASGELIQRVTIADDTGAGQAVWNGVELAVALPKSVHFLRENLAAREVEIATGDAWPLGAVAAANGTSVLVVGEFEARRYCSGLSMVTCWGGERYANATLTGEAASTERLLSAKFVERLAFSVAAGGDGYLLVWSENNDLLAQRLDQSGRAAGPAHAIARTRKPAASQVHATRDGWVVVWDDLAWGGVESSNVAELDANGALADAAVRIGTDIRSPALIKTGEDRFRLYYRAADSIEMRTLTTGTPRKGRRRAIR